MLTISFYQTPCKSIKNAFCALCKSPDSVKMLGPTLLNTWFSFSLNKLKVLCWLVEKTDCSFFHSVFWSDPPQSESVTVVCIPKK